MNPERWIPLLLTGVTTLMIVQGVLVGTALPQIVAEFNVDYGFMGFLMAFWTLLMAVSPLALGRFIEGGDPFKTVSAILLVSSLSTLLTAAARDLATLNIARVIASLLAAPLAWPVCSRIVATRVQVSRVGYAVAAFNAGSMIGFAASYLIIWLANSSWRAAMAASSLLGLAYAPIPLLAGSYAGGTPGSGAEPTIASVGGNSSSGGLDRVRRMALLLFAGHFAALYTWGLLVSWLSTYLVAELKLSYGDIAAYMAVIAFVSVLLEILVGAYTDKLGSLGWRIVILFAGLWPSSLLLFAALLAPTPVMAALLITLSLLCWRVSSTSFWSVLNDVTPRENHGTVSRIFVAAAPLAGIASSIVNGLVVSVTGSLRLGILLSSLTQLSSPVFFKSAADLASKLGPEASQ